VERDLLPWITNRNPSRTLTRCLAAIACALVLVLLGFATPVHSHVGVPASPSMASVASGGSDHCTEPMGVDLPGHCHGSIHAHACCILLAAGTPIAAVSAAGWRLTRKPSGAGIAIAPIPRPPASLVA
jgi:hypothetical protein